MNIRALCTDIDGTLLDSRRELSQRTIHAIKSVKDKIPVILASARMPSAMRHLQQELDIMSYPLICFNGGYVIHFENGLSPARVLDSVLIPASICERIVSLAENTSLHISLYREDNWFVPAHDNWAEKEKTSTKVTPTIRSAEQVLDLWRNDNTGAHKVMCMGPSDEIDTMQAVLTKMFSQQIHIYRSHAFYLELAPRSISKASALKFLLKKLYDIDLADVMAFGDNYNDIEMIKSVGFGIAVSNARDEVKEVAKELTLNSKEDGVAIAIERHFG